MFDLALSFFVLQAVGFGGGRRLGCAPWFAHFLHFDQLFGESLKRGFSIRGLRAAFGGLHDEATGAMCQAHTGFDFVAMLTAGAARNKKLQVGIAFQGISIGFVFVHLCWLSSSYLTASQVLLRIGVRFHITRPFVAQ